ncbi:lipopolysaccharide transport periplasmic protein LptA [Pseudoprimorskyibacter insulae]|uniref:Lipopolysaccharide export system protein LptA n=1 Tax=Pseudoprimorskyibacter insulae TaxID=1695997 RepID=A0A2R8AU12_9RHOB|nr:lipopolysaccharide transport periplasmic protein LptA [Pseudoprimorskyibacter insulae]SPF79364.1 Lipopolysaccharide export system protein LptA [Pseudoprimorskyibacter insulae]
MFFRSALLICSLALAPFAGLAQGTNVGFGASEHDTSQPVEVSADSLKVNQDDGTAIYSGNVVIVQGQMRLAAAEVIVIFNKDRSAIDMLKASGGVTLVSGPDAAEAQNADYAVETGNVVMTGNVLLTQGTNAATAERMDLNLETGQANLSGRVTTILQPAKN